MTTGCQAIIRASSAVVAPRRPSAFRCPSAMLVSELFPLHVCSQVSQNPGEIEGSGAHVTRAVSGGGGKRYDDQEPLDDWGVVYRGQNGQFRCMETCNDNISSFNVPETIGTQKEEPSGPSPPSTSPPRPFPSPPFPK